MRAIFRKPKRSIPRIQVAIPMLETLREIQSLLSADATNYEGLNKKYLHEAATSIGKVRGLVMVAYMGKRLGK